MKIAVTGASGFIGQHVCAAATRLGHALIPIGRALADPATWRASIDNGAERIIHLAFPGVAERATDGMPFAKTSSEAAADALAGTRVHLVVASSAAVFGPYDSPVDENSPCNPVAPYGEAKLVTERLLETASTADGWPLTVARIFNVLGPGLPAGLLATDLIARLTSAKQTTGPIPLGPLHTRRDYVDVREVADRLCRLPVGRFNLCRGEATSGLELVTHLCALMNVDPSRLKPATGHGGVPFSSGSTAKLKQVGLELTVGWRESLEATLE